MRFGEKGEKGIRMASMLVTVITLVSLADIFFDALLSCLLLLWKHTAGGIAVPVLGDGKEIELKLLSWISFGLALVAVYGLRKRLKAVFQGKPWRWYAILILPLLMVAIVIYMANWGASYGVFFRSAGDMGIYYDQIFTYIGWGVLSGLSLFAVAVSVFGMDKIYVEQKKAEQYRVQAAVYQTLEEQYTQAERLRHDLKNHVLALRGLWEEKAWEKLGDYLKRMEDGARFGKGEEATGNRAIDALLCQKRKLAEEKGIGWECDVRIPNRCRVNEFDLCILFGNLLDNALEACGRLQQKGKEKGQGEPPFIRVQAQTVKSCFLLEVINSMDAEEQREEMIKNLREEREEQQKKLEEEREKNKNDKIVDTVEISEDGKVLLKENTAAESGAVDGVGADGANPDGETNEKPKANAEPVFYSSAGTVEQSENTGTKVSASV